MGKRKRVSSDPIVEEIHALRARHAAECNNDLKAMFEDIWQHQQRSGKTYMSLSIRPESHSTAVCEDLAEYATRKTSEP